MLEKLSAWAKVAGTAVTALQHYLGVLPFLPAWVAPTVAATAVILDDMPTVLDHVNVLVSTFTAQSK